MPGRIELVPGLEHAVDDLASFSRIWLLFLFHRNVEEGRGWTAKVLPPRSATRRGVLATRSPHRPNPIGLSCVQLLRVEGLVLHVADLDLLDGTPILDVKPYLPYADAFPEASSGWPSLPDETFTKWQVLLDPLAAAQLAWLRERGLDLEPQAVSTLTTSPRPHPSRRIRKSGAGLVLALKEWRFDFSVDGASVRISRVRSGYKPSDLLKHPLHRAFSKTFV